MRKKIIISLAFILILFLGCRHSPDVPVSPIFTFDKDVASITLNNCATAGCHDKPNDERRPLVTYADVMHYVKAGKPYDSKLFKSMIKLSGNRMPPQGLLTDQQIKSVYIWILQGAREN